MTKTKHATKPRSVPAFIGIDLAKNSVHVHGVDESGRSCIDRKMRPAKENLWTVLKVLEGLSTNSCIQRQSRADNK